MSIRQLPSPRWTIPGNSGTVSAGYHVYTYQPGTSTPKATYTDHTGNTQNTNPIILDARGEANIWWDGQYKVLAYTGDKDAGGVLVWSQDNYGEGTSAVLQGNFNLVLNGSFEQDVNGDDLPDDWTIVEYTDGTVERDSIEQIHGAYSLKFLSVGTGGGYATSAFFEVQEGRFLPIIFSVKSSVATVHNQVDVIWYTSSRAVISTTTIHDDSSSNQSAWTTYSYTATAPALSRYAKIRIFGAKDDVLEGGAVWFDNIIVESTVPGASRGALVYNSSNQSVGILEFDSKSYDTDGFHDPSTNASRLTVPAGVSKVRVSGAVEAQASSASYMLLQIIGSVFDVSKIGLPAIRIVPIDSASNNLSVSSGVIQVSEGDYFELSCITSDSLGTIFGSTGFRTWFCIETVE